MAHMLMICPLCKHENTAGTRFCKYCGRLLVEPDLEVSAMEPAPLYATHDDGEGQRWEGERVVDATASDSPSITDARVVIRAYPADFDGADSVVATRVGEYALEGQTVTVGRGQSCDIVFDRDSMVSRRHVILRPVANRYTVADLGSSNGTFLNDLEIREPTPLNHGDRILIGQHELLFLLDQPQPISATAPQPVAAQSAITDAAVTDTAVSEADTANVPDATDAPEAPASTRATAAPVGATAKYASVARLSSELAASASRMVAPQQDAELDAIRARLVEASEALTQQAGTQAALAERRRAALVETRERVADILADLRGDDAEGNSPTHLPPTDLVEVVSRVAADPNNLENLRALASVAGAIARALRAQGPTEGQWAAERARTIHALEDIHYRLQERS